MAQLLTPSIPLTMPPRITLIVVHPSFMLPLFSATAVVLMPATAVVDPSMPSPAKWDWPCKEKGFERAATAGRAHYEQRLTLLST